MPVNRYTQQNVYSQFSPLSIQELAMLPLAKQQQHDSQLAANMQQKAQAAALAADEEAANGFISDIDNRINTNIESLMQRGVSQSSARNLLELKQYRDHLLSPQGDLGKIQANHAAYQAYYEDQKKRFEKGDITRDKFQQSVAASLQGYKGYQEGNFSGYTPTKYVDVAKKSIEFGEKIKHNVYQSQGYKNIGIDPITGKSIWQKDGHTISDVPPGTDRLILDYLQNDPEIRAQMQDDVYLTKTLGLYNKDEMGNVVAGGKYYNPENPEGAAEAMANDRLYEAAKSGFGVASSGKEDIWTKDLDFVGIDSGDGGGNKFNRNGVGLGEDLGRTSQYYAMTMDELNTSIANATGNEKAKLERHKKFIEGQFKNTPDGQRLSKLYSPEKYTASEAKLKEIVSAANSMVKNQGYDETGGMINPNVKNAYQAIVANKHILKNKGYSLAEIAEAEKYAKASQHYMESLDKFAKEGLVQEAKSYAINTFDESSRSNLNHNVKNTLSPANYNIPGMSEEEKINAINDMKASSEFAVETINSYGEYAKPTITIRYKDNKGVLQVVDVELKSLGKGKIPSSASNIIDYLTVDDSDINAELKGNVAYSDVPIGADSNLTQVLDLPNKAIEQFSNIQVLRGNEGNYYISFTYNNGKVVPSEKEFPSKSAALDAIYSYVNTYYNDNE